MRSTEDSTYWGNAGVPLDKIPYENLPLADCVNQNPGTPKKFCVSCALGADLRGQMSLLGAHWGYDVGNDLLHVWMDDEHAVIIARFAQHPDAAGRVRAFLERRLDERRRSG